MQARALQGALSSRAHVPMHQEIDDPHPGQLKAPEALGCTAFRGGLGLLRNHPADTVAGFTELA